MSELPLRLQARILEISKHTLWTAPPTSVQDSYRFAWMRGIALMNDAAFEGRWYWWLHVLAKGSLDQPYEMPECDVTTNGYRTEGGKMLERCMNCVYAAGYRITDFIEWIGYALGIAWFQKPRIPERLWEQLYREFNLDLLQKRPADYFSHFIGEHGQSGHLDYYPTPIDLTVLINQLVKPSQTTSQFEPCLGAGSMILPSASLNLVGADLSLTMVKVASIQAFLYLPSMLYVPFPVIGLHVDKETLTINRYFEFNTNTRIYRGDSFLGEYMAPLHIFEENSEWVDIYCFPKDERKREVYNYDEYYFQTLESIPYEKRVEITKAQAREIPFQIITTNPPFNAHIGKEEMKKLREIEESNQQFLAERQQRLQAMKQL